ncbi:MAG: glycosyltransferase family 2 protein [Thermoanaerobaculia bacterium]|nr:glycosyltransferase family 2 protein [Thermoanaerobaculia bacterium]
MSASQRRLSILVASWNGRRHLEICLPAVAAQRDPGCEWELLLLDNGSRDGTADWVRVHHPWVRLVESPTNLGFAAANNRLADLAEGDFLILLNNDTHPAPDWLAALADAAAAAAPDVAAIGGRLVDWEGERLDFGYGLRTFDGHAFQLDFRRSFATARMPASGEELAFACGANMLVRRRSFLAAGGFDPAYFAYLEDVDLGWRLWAGGERIEACGEAVVRHRSAATSDRVGPFVRGSLFERNALLNAYKNLDDELWPQLMPAILLTFLARLESIVVAGNSGAAELLRRDPFTGAVTSRDAAGAAAGGLDPSWLGKLRRLGPAEFTRRVWGRISRRLRRVVAGGGFELSHPQALSHLRAMSLFLAVLDDAAAVREVARQRRRRSDRELCERFPLYLVPTYLGDEALFASSGFSSLLPASPVLARATLSEVMELPGEDAR